MGNSDSVVSYARIDWESADDVLLKVKVGDLIEFQRIFGIYSHWAVYVGGGYVVNYGRKYPTRCIVQKEQLDKVSDGGRCRINNLVRAACSKNLSPHSGDTIAQRALDRIGEESPYSALNNNCEFFATECRYGEGFTCQPTEWAITGGHIFGGGAMGYRAGRDAIAEGRWTDEEVADYLFDSWANSAMY